jgi:pyrroline-5-carboxylate reductase
MKLLVIGGGNMGLTYAEAIGKSKFLSKEDLTVVDQSEDRVNALKSHTLLTACSELDSCLPSADIILLAVKPQQIKELMETMRSMVNAGQIFVSIMAGVTIDVIQKGLQVTKVVRAMPNLPAQLGLGMTSFTASAEVSKVELATVEKLLDTTGRSIHMDTEKEIDASTGISGSGPAYVFYFMQSMMEAAKSMGFDDKESRLLVQQTFAGAVELFRKSDLNPEEWMDRVASKGGTTRAALDSMDDNNVKEQIKDAAYAAFNRAVELGKEMNNG